MTESGRSERRASVLFVESHRFAVSAGLGWAAPFSLPRFDPSQGTLLRVEVRTFATARWNYALENQVGLFSLVHLPAQGVVRLERADGTLLGLADADSTMLVGLPAFDGFLDCQGPSSFHYTGSRRVIDRRTFAPDGTWSGAGTIDLVLENTLADFGSPLCLIEPPSVAGHAIVSYVYEPPVVDGS